MGYPSKRPRSSTNRLYLESFERRDLLTAHPLLSPWHAASSSIVLHASQITEAARDALPTVNAGAEAQIQVRNTNGAVLGSVSDISSPHPSLTTTVDATVAGSDTTNSSPPNTPE